MKDLSKREQSNTRINSAERENLEARIEKMKRVLDSLKGKTVSFSGEYAHYFKLEIYDKDGIFLGYR